MLVVFTVVERVDIAFAMDASATISRGDWQDMSVFMAQTMQRFKAHPSVVVRASVVTFGVSPHTKFHFDAYRSIDDVRRAMWSLKQRDTPVDIGGGLRHVREDVFGGGGGGGAVRICVLVTDGASPAGSDVSRQEAARLANVGVTTLVIGVGSGVREAELLGVTLGEAGRLTVLDSFYRLISRSNLDKIFADIMSKETFDCAI